MRGRRTMYAAFPESGSGTDAFNSDRFPACLERRQLFSPARLPHVVIPRATGTRNSGTSAALASAASKKASRSPARGQLVGAVVQFDDQRPPGRCAGSHNTKSACLDEMRPNAANRRLPSTPRSTWRMSPQPHLGERHEIRACRLPQRTEERALGRGEQCVRRDVGQAGTSSLPCNHRPQHQHGESTDHRGRGQGEKVPEDWFEGSHGAAQLPPWHAAPQENRRSASASRSRAAPALPGTTPNAVVSHFRLVPRSTRDFNDLTPRGLCLAALLSIQVPPVHPTDENLPRLRRRLPARCRLLARPGRHLYQVHRQFRAAEQRRHLRRCEHRRQRHRVHRQPHQSERHEQLSAIYYVGSPGGTPVKIADLTTISPSAGGGAFTSLGGALVSGSVVIFQGEVQRERCPDQRHLSRPGWRWHAERRGG